MNYDYGKYWERCWNEENIQELFNYLDRYFEMRSTEIDIFKENNIKNICDAACGSRVIIMTTADSNDED